MAEQGQVQPIKPRPTVCAECGLAGHAKNVCPDLHPVEIDITEDVAADVG